MQRLIRKRLTLDDPDFGRIEYSDGIWTSTPTPDRDYLVHIVASDRGPTESQRQLFHTLLESRDEIIDTTERFLKQHRDVAEEIGLTELRLYSIEVGNLAGAARGDFAIELADADPSVADAVFGVRYYDGVPKAWYIDH